MNKIFPGLIIVITEQQSVNDWDCSKLENPETAILI